MCEIFKIYSLNWIEYNKHKTMSNLEPVVFVLSVLSLSSFIRKAPDNYAKELVANKGITKSIAIKTAISLSLFLFCTTICYFLFRILEI